MDNKADEADNPSWKSLVRIPDGILRQLNREDIGKEYGAVLLELQIRPENHMAFFDGNIRPFRNKKEISALIARGDDDSLLKVSKAYVTAYGSIAWGNDRRWLLSGTELEGSKQPLNYSPPRVRKDGDHDRFYHILGKLWKHMRSIIFELRSRVQQGNGIGNSKSAQGRGQGYTSPLTPPPQPLFISTRRGIVIGQHPPPANLDPFARMYSAYDRPAQVPGRSLDNGLRANGSVTTEGNWPVSRTEEAITNAINDLIEAYSESHPEVFRTLLHRHLARLEEIEQFGEQQVRLAAQKDVVKAKKKDDVAGDETEPNGESDDIDASNTQLSTAPEIESSNKADIVRTDTDATQPTSIPSLTIKPSTTNRATNTEQIISYSDQHRQTNLPPPFSLSTYIPPTIPNRMTVYITPYVHTAMHFSQPWIWPDAPVHPTSYIAFRNGIRLRANVPDSVPEDRMTMVFGYGWDDFCCVVSGEESWRDWFMRDLMHAGKRGGVGVWRMRVCVVGGRGA